MGFHQFREILKEKEKMLWVPNELVDNQLSSWEGKNANPPALDFVP